MVVFFISLSAVLLALNIYQFNSRNNQKKEIMYAYKKMKEINDGRTHEKVLLHTTDKGLQKLLVEMNRLLLQNQQSLAEYSKTENSMRKMLSNISHDLKTPLTVVIGYLEMMQHDPLLRKEEIAIQIAKVHDKAKEVLDLINKFFELARIESGDKEFTLERLDLNEVCKKSLLDFYDSLISKGIEVVIDIPEQSLYIQGNVEALERILNNLLSNAIQYGNAGHTLGLSIRQAGDQVSVDVWDKGKGIHEQHQNLVFERMYTLEDSRNKQYQGSGLGLTITKRLVEQMGGEISLVSIPFERTTFTCTFQRFIY